MNILIAGGSGFIGRHLTKFLRKSHQVVILTRSPQKIDESISYIEWDGKKLVTQQSFDVIINLCGMNIATKRWSKKNKKKLTASRVQPTQAIVDFIKQCHNTNKPQLINASAIGYYPNSQSKQDENNAIQSAHLSFSQQLVSQWEQCALAALNEGVSVTCLRFGVVLGRNGGLIARLLPSYKLALGAIIGNRHAHLSWVHIDDLCRAVSFILSVNRPCSVYNITATKPCTQLEFSKTLARLCQRPCFLQLPPFFVKKIFGQMGKELLLADQKIYPQNLIKQGFNFNYQTIAAALQSILSNNQETLQA